MLSRNTRSVTLVEVKLQELVADPIIFRVESLDLSFASCVFHRRLVIQVPLDGMTMKNIIRWRQMVKPQSANSRSKHDQ